ncbi:c-type cytochrome [Rhodovulum sp. DZ06]|uniref:c-type cytochrome n=1 Tax=Rhodovulum sp. DZ06 TaxID=3425126 RepID=UPI003D34446D
MDSMEINKIVGATVGALLVYLGVNFFTELAFTPAGGHGDEHHYAYALEIEEAGGGEEEVEVPFAELLAAADPGKGARVFNKCKACHKLDGSDGTGPHLNGVVGRDIAASAGFGYSGALSGMEGDWTPEELSAFLEKPSAYAPGTAMSFAGLKSAEQRADLIAYLATQE